MAPSLELLSEPGDWLASVTPMKAVAGVTAIQVSGAQAALDVAKDRFIARNPRSWSLHERATTSMPGGNTRTQLHTAPFPVYLKSGKGYQVTSEDGDTYTDFVGELTAAVYGHSHPAIIQSMLSTLLTVGMNLGGTIAQEHIHASEMCRRFDIDMIRFTNCGTEANLHALAAVRAYTGNRKVVVFGGGYHGGVLTFGGGVPAANNVDRADFIVAQYNDIDSARSAILQDGVAAVLLEGMQGAPGAIPAHLAFLRAVGETAKKAGVIFILDEVMTSRVAPGGLASLLPGVRPDMKTFGKYLGGGLAFGAFGGRADIMAMYDPRNSSPAPLTHHGTFNNNTLAMTVGHVGLTEIYTPDVCREFNEEGNVLLDKLNQVTAGTKMCFTGIGTVLASHFTDEGLRTLDRETKEDWELKELFWLEMLEDGFWITKRGSIALVLGTPASELDRFVECVVLFLERHNGLIRVE